MMPSATSSSPSRARCPRRRAAGARPGRFDAVGSLGPDVLASLTRVLDGGASGGAGGIDGDTAIDGAIGTVLGGGAIGAGGATGAGGAIGTGGAIGAGSATGT